MRESTPKGRAKRGPWVPIDDPGPRDLIRDLTTTLRFAQSGDVDMAILCVLALGANYKPLAVPADLERCAPLWKAMLAELAPRPKAARRTKRKVAKPQSLAEPLPELQKNEHA